MPEPASLPVSVLDLAPVTEGSTASQALSDMVELARAADDLGCRRFWVAEHHNTPGIASCAPPVLVAAVAAATRTIRAGSGGVMLPNHAPLTVAEQFATLDALHPGRIDLGVGRAPGTDQATAHALRRRGRYGGDVDFPAALDELLSYLSGRSAALPAVSGGDPEVWLLGTSMTSAVLAGTLGLPYAYAHHLHPHAAAPTLTAYRQSFDAAGHRRPSYALACVRVICGETDDDARRLAAPAAVAAIRAGRGSPHGRYPRCDDAIAELTREQEAGFVRSREAQAIGGPETVRRRLASLVEEIRPDELMVTAVIPDLAGRMSSLQRVMDLVKDTRPAAVRR